MKNKKILKGILCILLISCLCGCSLAIPDAGAEGGSDRMIGVFITREFLDLFDMEQYLNDHISGFRNGQEAQFSYDAKYEGKLYASIDKSKGDAPNDWEISFGNLDGISMFTPFWTPENEEPYWGSVCTEGVCDLNINYYESDDSEEHSISGTVYMLPGKTDESMAFYANPVYQTADGSIYVTGGNGVSASGESGEGMELSSTLEGETAVTENGRTKAEKSSVSVRYAVMYKPVRITICQMDQEHRIIKEDAFKPEEVPEQLHVEKGTEYVLVEMEKEGTAGEKTVSREVYNCNSDEDVWITTYRARDDGIVVKQETRVRWGR